MAKLRIITGQYRETVFELDTEGWAKSIGRDADSVEFHIADRSISRKHCELFFRDGQWSIRDLKSSNGTFVNEQRIGQVTILHHQDQVRIGGTVLLFENDLEADMVFEQTLDTTPIELEFDPGETMISVAFDGLQTKQSAREKERLAEAGQAALNMSHGIKNILQAVSTGQDVVDQGFQHNDIDQAKKAWMILKRNLDLIQKLVLDMLKFSKDTGLSLQMCQFSRLVDTVVEIARPKADQRSVGITVRCDEQIGLVELDPDQVRDVILNLVLNAIEAVPTQNGMVTVTAEQDIEKQELVLRVCDNGPGIEDTESIFLPFHTGKTKIGTGLGLAIVKKIVEQHNGSIDVQSIPDEGTIFCVKLPLVKQSN